MHFQTYRYMANKQQIQHLPDSIPWLESNEQILPSPFPISSTGDILPGNKVSVASHRRWNHKVTKEEKVAEGNGWIAVKTAWSDAYEALSQAYNSFLLPVIA